MRLKFFSLVVATFFFCFPAFPDTFDTHTLCAVTVAEKGDLEFLYKIRADIVGRKGDVYKALLTDGQICLLREHDVKVEVLYDEMAAERALFATPRFCSNTAWPCYYTASTFNTANPPSGSLMRHMLDLYNAHPSIVRLYDIGNSEDGAYDIIAMKITDNPDIEEAEPEIRIYGDIHGDEVSGMMVACDVLDWILANYATDADAQKLVNDGELWFIPQGNPWGLMNQTRYNSNDVDLNRNFWGPDGSSDGSGDFSEAETQAIRDLTEVMERGSSHRFPFTPGRSVSIRFTTTLQRRLPTNRYSSNRARAARKAMPLPRLSAWHRHTLTGARQADSGTPTAPTGTSPTETPTTGPITSGPTSTPRLKSRQPNGPTRARYRHTRPSTGRQLSITC